MKEASSNLMKLIISTAAKAAYNANKAYCEALGDLTQPEWEVASFWHRKSLVSAVKAVLDNPGMSPEDNHNNWLYEMRKEGWVYGEKKNVEAKIHSCMRPYFDLPQEQRAQDHIFLVIVKSILAFYGLI